MSIEVKILNTSGTPLLWEPDAASLIAAVEAAVKRGVPFTAADFRGMDLHGANLSGGSFVGAKFEGANLIGTNFTSANLTNADFSGAATTEATWTTATLTNTDKDALATDSDATKATQASATPAADTIVKSSAAGKLAAGWGGAASTLATLNSGTKVVEDPANATATPTASKIPIADGAGKLAAGWGGSASTLATLNASAKVVEDPANATATPTASKIPIADGAGKLAAGWGGSASTLATLDGAAKVVEDPANATATPTASKIPIANASGFLAEGWRRAAPTAYDFATAVPYTVLATDESLDITTGAVSDDVDLPTAVGCAGRIISVKKVDAGVGVCAVDPNGVEVIEGLGAGNPYNLTAQYQGVTLRSDGAKWHVVTSTTTTAAHAATHNPAGADEYKPAAVDTAAATPFAVLTTHRTLRCAAGAGAPQVVNLYAADAAAVGRRLAFIKTDANVQNVAVTPNGADTINGVNNATLSTLTTQWDFVEIECVAAGAWMLISRRIT